MGSNTGVKDGGSCVLICDVTRLGHPIEITSKTWYHNNKEIYISTGNSGKYTTVDDYGLQLHVNYLNKNDTGLYRCEIRNAFNMGRFQGLFIRVECKSLLYSKDRALPHSCRFLCVPNGTCMC